ncbi:hypothetical protein H632_c3194p0 [Helicosporidium sp. ATCC 50920]|nr:hypothetical protein H632_c3194p0 [Helicosporidium sp. ATCC 50920]|eukprot:KDD72556.1 hypothetical protein H632_c3194p0 [Helicosporidium sp. ATCC 50920]
MTRGGEVAKPPASVEQESEQDAQAELLALGSKKRSKEPSKVRNLPQAGASVLGKPFAPPRPNGATVTTPASSVAKSAPLSPASQGAATLQDLSKALRAEEEGAAIEALRPKNYPWQRHSSFYGVQELRRLSKEMVRDVVALDYAALGEPVPKRIYQEGKRPTWWPVPVYGPKALMNRGDCIKLYQITQAMLAEHYGVKLDE